MLTKSDPAVIRSYFEDYSNLKGGNAEEAVFPASIEELAEFVKRANYKKMPLTISGGGTGTTGARIPFGGAIVSMEKFNSVLNISQVRMSAAVQAGVMVEELKNLCEEKGLFYTSHPTEKSAFVGGTIATNASGARSFKYGPTRKYVKGLKMVLANGETLDLKRGERIITKKDAALQLAGALNIDMPLPTYRMPDVKNSAGYFVREEMDLIDLFIGQEGTLSIIVEAELGLVARPPKIFSSFVFFKNEADSWEFSKEIRALSKDKVSQKSPVLDALSLEYFDNNALNLLRLESSNVPGNATAAIFFEQEVSGDEDALVEKWLNIISRHNASLDDTWVAMNEKEAEGFTELRHSIPESVNEIVKRRGFQKLSTDISVPPNGLGEMMDFYVHTLKNIKIDHIIFGHIGECHVHVNILPRSEEEFRKGKEACESFVMKGVSLGGSISAEHGVGKTRHKYLEMMYGAHGVLEMARLKKALDPNWILGPDNIFPRETFNLV